MFWTDERILTFYLTLETIMWFYIALVTVGFVICILIPAVIRYLRER